MNAIQSTLVLKRAIQSQPSARKIPSGSGRKLRPQKGSGQARVGSAGVIGRRGGRVALDAGGLARKPKLNKKLARAAWAQWVGDPSVGQEPMPALTSMAQVRAFALARRPAQGELLLLLKAPDALWEKACSNLERVRLCVGDPSFESAAKAKATLLLT